MDQINKNKAEKFDAYFLLLSLVKKDDRFEIENIIVNLERNIIDFEDMGKVVDALVEYQISPKMQVKISNSLAVKVSSMEINVPYMRWYLLFDSLDQNDNINLVYLKTEIFKQMIKAGSQTQLKVFEFGLHLTAQERFVEPIYFELLKEEIIRKN